MEYIVKSGWVKWASYRGYGKLLISSRHVYALSEDHSAALAGGIVGGMVGALVVTAVDSFQNRNSQPEFLDDADLPFLDESMKKSLRKTKLLVKLALGEGLAISPTFAGFDFTIEGQPPLVWRGLIHKGKVRRFLEARGGKMVRKKVVTMKQEE
jgi:hypothetical protein